MPPRGIGTFGSLERPYLRGRSISAVGRKQSDERHRGTVAIQRKRKEKNLIISSLNNSDFGQT